MFDFFKHLNILNLSIRPFFLSFLFLMASYQTWNAWQSSPIHINHSSSLHKKPGRKWRWDGWYKRLFSSHIFLCKAPPSFLSHLPHQQPPLELVICLILHHFHNIRYWYSSLLFWGYKVPYWENHWILLSVHIIPFFNVFLWDIVYCYLSNPCSS